MPNIGGMIAMLLGVLLGTYYAIWLLFLIIHKVSLKASKNKTESVLTEKIINNLKNDNYKEEIPENFLRDNPIKLGCFGWSFFIPFILFFLLTTYVIIKIKIDNYFDKKEMKANEEIIEKEIERRISNLEKSCIQDSKITVYQKVPKKYGMYIRDSYSSGEYVKKRLRQERRTKFEQCKIEMHRLIKKKGGNLPVELYCESKHFTVVKFLDNFSGFWSEFSAKTTHAAFFEGIGDFNNYKNFSVDGVPLKKYIEEENYKNKNYYKKYGIFLSENDFLVRFATKEWWINSRMSNNTNNHWIKHYIKDIHINGINNEDFINSKIPITQLMADYIFDIEDISTIEDIEKGIRRGHITLIDINSNILMSEYTTFDLIPLFYNYPDRSNLHCGNLYTKEKEQYSEGYDSYQIFKYFFEHAVDQTQKN